jgi:hypothetical protein
MEAGPENQRLLTALTTEHFTLQGSRGSTVSESSVRSSLYLGALSSTLIGLGFFVNVGGASSDAFRVFALTALTTVFVLGIFTYTRLVQSSVEDIFYGRAINRIRHHYLELAGDRSHYFMLVGNDDPLGVVRNMAVVPSRWQLYFTNAMAIAVVNAVVGGGVLALATGVATGAPLGISAAVGGVFAILYLVRATRWERSYHTASADRLEVLFPSADSPSR